MNTIAFDNTERPHLIASSLSPSSSNDTHAAILTKLMMNNHDASGGPRRVSEVQVETTGNIGYSSVDNDGKGRNGRGESFSSTVEDMNSNMFTKFAFPFKLHSILEHAQKNCNSSIISWLPSGKAFKIHKPKEFAEIIMPQYFNQTKYRSFQRQLYIYGFDRIKDKSSEDFGAYFHELFIRGATDLCLDMTRKKIKGTGLSNAERQRKAAAAASINGSGGARRRSRTTKSSTKTAKNEEVVNDNRSLFPSLSLSLQQGQASSNLCDHDEETTLAVAHNNTNTVSMIDSLQGIVTSLNGGHNNNSINKSSLGGQFLPQRKTTVGRRCSLGFIRGTRMGRRGSLLFDGDEVCFGDKKFFFTAGF